MMLDWFTVVAQIVNFLILVALLKYFLYGRIIKTMDERQQHIATRLAEAEQQRQEAVQAAATYRRAQQALEDERTAFLAQAREDAAAQRQVLHDQARDDVAHLHAGWREALQQAQTTFLHELRQRAGQQLVTIARRALMDLAHVDLEQQILVTFLEQLRTLEAAVWDSLAVKPPEQPLVIRSAFPLPHAARQQLQNLLQGHLGEGATLRFETSPALLCGIELQTHGQKIAWSLEHYVSTLEEHLAAAFAEETGATLATAAPSLHDTAREEYDDPGI